MNLTLPGAVDQLKRLKGYLKQLVKHDMNHVLVCLRSTSMTCRRLDITHHHSECWLAHQQSSAQLQETRVQRRCSTPDLSLRCKFGPGLEFRQVWTLSLSTSLATRLDTSSKANVQVWTRARTRANLNFCPQVWTHIWTQVRKQTYVQVWLISCIPKRVVLKSKQDHKNKTQNTLTTATVIMGVLEGGLLVERLASGGLGAGRIAWLTTRRILISLCCFSILSFNGALASASLSLMHAGDFQCRLLLLMQSHKTPHREETKRKAEMGIWWLGGRG